MKPKKKVEQAIRGKLRFTAGSAFRKRLLADVMSAQGRFQERQRSCREPSAGGAVLSHPVFRLASIAATIVIVVLSIMLWGRFTTPAYAIEQTVEALQNVRFLHLIARDEAGHISDERWIEIGADGFQKRYRQYNPARPRPTIIDDGESTAVYHRDRRAVILYDRSERQYQWVTPLGAFFENLRREGRILKRNDRFQGQPAHRVWWPAMSSECFIDPKTKLPLAIGQTQLSYETPAPGTFQIIIPADYTAVDCRPGAPAAPLPEWLIEQEAVQENMDAYFREGAHALAQGDYRQAVERFEYIVENNEHSNWAWFWLGRAYCGLGQYDLAVEKFTCVLETMGRAFPCHYCNYARGLAYARLGETEAAEADVRVCLPAMVYTLRIPSTGWMFEFAEDPMLQQGGDMPSNQEIVTNMIGRLRRISGRDFGYDANAPAERNEAAIAAWERWLQEDGQIRFTPDSWPTPAPVAEGESNR